MKNLWPLLFAGLLAACTTSADLAKDASELSTQLRSTQVSPVPLNSLAFQMLSLESNNQIDITADSPIVDFSEGNSFAAALLLPEHMSGFTFTLESVIGLSVFVPSVVFLNENLQEVSRIDNAKLNAKKSYSIEKQFSAEMSQAIRYILVYSKDSALDGRTERPDPAREYELSRGKELSEQAYPKLYAKHSPIGNIIVSLEDVFYSAQAVNVGLVAEGSTVNKTAPLITAPTILNDTEAFYLEQISKAIKENNLSRALSLVEEAERAGSTKAKSHYTAELEKQQQ